MDENEATSNVVSMVPDISDAASPRDLSDDALALQFTDEFYDRARYTPAAQVWYVWDSRRWKRDDTNAAFNHCRRMLRKIALQCYKAAYNRLFEPTEKRDEGNLARAQRRHNAKAKAVSQVKPLKSQRTRDSVIRMAMDDPRITMAPDQWDGENSRMLFNTPAGTVDLRTGIMRPTRQADYITKMARTSPLDTPTPHWTTFLIEATGGDADLMAYLQRVFGYCMTGDTSEQTLFFCHGPTGTGKSVVTNAISYVLGEYRYDTSEGTFSSQSADRHTQDIARLANARFVTAQETEQGSRWNESRIKRLTGQDKVTARLMRQNDFEYTPQMKIFIIGNFKPILSNVDDAIRRRFHLIPLTKQVPRSKMNKRLGDLLEAEAPGILHWMVQGCLAWQEHGLNPPDAVIKATDKYLYEEDNIAAWMDECCDLKPDTWTASGALYDSWKRWAHSGDIPAGPKNTFSEYLDNRSESIGIQRVRKARGPGFSGISLIGKAPQ